MTSPAFPELPADLQARLDAAGVTDAATLAAALDADPELQREYQAFLEANRDAIVAANRAILLDALSAIPDEEQLRALWQMIPSEDEDTFLAATEARAAAAETSGDAGLAAALRERIDALRSFQQEIARDGEILRQALERLEAATTDDDLAAVWRDVPLELEETFLNIVALQAEEHEQHGDAERAAHVRTRHERLSAIQQQQRAGAETMRRLLEQLAADVEALAAAADHQGVVDVWNRIPLELEEPFLQLTEHLAGELEQTDAATAARLRERIALLRQVREERETAQSMVRQALERLEAASSSDEAWQVWLDLPGDLEEWFLRAITERIEEVERDDTGLAERLRAAHARMRDERNRSQERANRPVVQALRAFLNAPGDADATRVFNEYKALLQPFEAQRALDDLAQQAPDEQRAAIAARAALLRRLRGGDPAPRPTPAAATPAETRTATPGGIVYINSAVVEGGSGTAIVYNNIVMERRWLRPTPPPLPRPMITRDDDLRQVIDLLNANDSLAISGLPTATVQGMPGVGKTVLAQQLALTLDPDYPDGVIWQPVGPDFTTLDQAQATLNQWARYAITIPQDPGTALQFDASAVRALFGGRRLLVVLDDVWSLDAVRPLRDALPPGARLVVTTRLRGVMVGLGGAQHQLGVLSATEARQLIALRLGWPAIPAEELAWCNELAAGMEYHTLALDVALGALLLEGEESIDWRTTAARLTRDLLAGRGFEDLRIAEGDREQNVERALAYSYMRMDAILARSFRELGVFAAGDSFATNAAAGLWQCDEMAAKRRLDLLVNAALLQRSGAGRWRQHSLLRGYALALLRREGEHEAAAARHAAFYAAAMRAADDAQRFYEVLGDYAQLRHAFAWAIENDLELAQDLVANTANLQKAHGYGRDNLAWAEQALAAAHRRGTPAQIARARVSLGDALQHVATLAEEDRAARLRQALSAYDEALRFVTPTGAPLDYAMTQNNRGNVLQDLATLAEEDRAARLRQALSAYDEALRFYTPTSAPLDYAMTQNNRAVLLSDLASVPGEDRGARLREALRCALTAVELFARLQHEQYYQVSRRALQDVRAACGDDFDTLWAALDAGPPPEWLIAPEEGETSSLLSRLIQRLLAVSSGEELLAFWRELPAELEEPLAAAAEEAAHQARQAGDAAMAQALRERAAGLRAIRAAADAAQSKIQQSWQHYIELVEAAEAAGNDITAWRAAVEAGEALLAPEFADVLGIGDAVREHVASTWNALGNALHNAGDGEAAVAAYDRAIALQPDKVMWRRNRVATLIDLGRRAEAAEELA
ncbi:NB-ARC domain-containing protein, partial [Roseiflexus sp.]